MIISSSSAMAANVCVDDLTENAANAADCDTDCSGGDNNCNIRDAIAAASASDTIIFKTGLTGTMHTTSTITMSTGSVTIDGTANAHSHDIVFDGTGTGGIDCFTVSSASNVIKGLVIGNCLKAINLSGTSADNNKIQGNYIGTNTAGSAASANQVGVYIAAGQSGNIVGTDGDGSNDAAELNLISGSTTYGVYLYSTATTCTGNYVSGNYLGLGADGSTAIANIQAGVAIVGSNGVGPSGNYIGVDDSKSAPSAMLNVISGSTNYGVYISNADSNYVMGNYIGTRSNGTVAAPNAKYGVYIYKGSDNNVIGTDADGDDDTSERNVISGQSGGGDKGLLIEGTGTGINIPTGNKVMGNYIGVDKDGNTALANNVGVSLTGYAQGNIIGTNGDGTNDASERNVISGNGSDGVILTCDDDDLVSGNYISGNYIGVGADGTTDLGNGGYGVDISGLSTGLGPNLNYIGVDDQKTAPGAMRDVIANNAWGGIMIMMTDSNYIMGNYIGVDASGETAAGNTVFGVMIWYGSDNNIIGTDADGDDDALERNIISGQSGPGEIGVEILGLDVDPYDNSGNKIQGNYIGLDYDGTDALPNDLGVYIGDYSTSNIIGTNGDGVNDTAERNVISGNTTTGIQITSATATSNTIAGNYIGTAPNGTTSKANGTYGIYLLTGTAGNTIGGDIAAESNLIRYNGTGIAVAADGGGNNAFLRNQIYDSTTAEITVGANTTTAPSAIGGADGGSSGAITISMTSTAGYTVQVFKDEDGDGNCEAKTYLGNATDAGGGTFTYATSGLTKGTKITATARDTDGSKNTSVLATCYAITDLNPVLASIGSKSVNEAVQLQFITSAYDPNTDDTITYSATDLPEGASFDTDTHTFTWTPTTSQSGVYNVTFKATAATVEDSEVVEVTVNNVPELASITITDSSGYTNDTTPSIAISRAGAVASHVAFSCNGGTNWSGWIVYGDTIDTFDITSGATGCSVTNELKTITAKLKTAGAIESGTQSDTTTYDSAGPTGSISDLTGTSTNDDTPSLVLTRADAGVGTVGVEMSFSCNNSDWSAWEAYATPKADFDIKPAEAAYGCGADDGARTVYVKFKDSLGNVGSAYNTGEFTLDTTGPTLTSIAITDTGGYGNDTTPTIDIVSAGTPSHVAFSCNGGTNWSAWIAYGDSISSFNMTTGATGCTTDNELKTITAKLKDAVTNESGTQSDTTTYDSTGPTGSISDLTGTSTNDDTPSLVLTRADAGVGTVGIEMSFSCNNSDWSAWEAYATPKTDFDIKPAEAAYGCGTDDGERTVYVRFKDSLGNTGSSYNTGAFTLDMASPTLTSITITDSGGYTNDTTPTIAISSSGSPSHVAFSCNGGTNWSSWIVYGDSISSFDMTTDATGCTTDNELKTITAKLKDAAGNESETQSDTTTYDNTGPTGSISNLAGTSTNDNTPSLVLTRADAGVGTVGLEMSFSCNNSDWNAWEAYATPKSNFDIKPAEAAYGCGTDDGARTVYVRFKDSLGNTGSSYNTGAFTLDVASPTLTSITITDSGGYTNDTTPTIDIVSEGSPSHVAFSCNGGTNWSGWIAYGDSISSFDMTTGATGCTTDNELKTLTAKLKDAAANESGTQEDTTTYDSSAPTLTSITISDTGGYGNDTTPTIDIASAGTPSHVAFSCNGGSDWSSWIAYGDSISTFNITNGATGCSATNELKTITAKLKDLASNESDTEDDTTTYDNAGPTGSISNLAGTSTNDDTPTLNLTIADAGVGTGSAEMSFSCNNSDWSAWEAYATPKSNFDVKPAEAAYGCGTDDGARTVYVRFKDSLTNVGSSYNTGAFTLDTANPTLTSIAISDTGGYGNDTTPTIDIVSADSPSHVAFSCNGGTNWSSWIVYGDSISSFDMTTDATGCTTDNELKTITAKLKDTAGNESETQSDTTTYDNTGPTGSISNLAGTSTSDDTPSLVLTRADAGVGTVGLEMSFSCNNSDWSAWEAYATPKSNFDIKPAEAAYGCGTDDGARTVYVKFRDSLGNAGSSYNTGAFTLDTANPTLTSIAISDTGGYGSDVTPTIDIVSEGSPSHVAFSCNGGTNWSAWIAYGDSISSFDMTTDATGCTADNELKTITAKLKDAAGNESDTQSDTTTYDNAGPTGSISNLAGTSTNDDTPSLVLTRADAGVGTVGIEMSFSCNDSDWSAWEAYATPKTDFDIEPAEAAYGCGTDDGARTVYVRFKDSLGNTGSSYNTGGFTLDMASPTLTSITITDSGGYTNDTTPTIAISSSGSPSHVAFSCNGGTNWSTWIAYGDSISSFDMTTGATGCNTDNELKTITAKLKDAAANESGTVADTTTYDSTAPTGSIDDLTGTSTNDDTPTLNLSIADTGIGTTGAEMAFSCNNSDWNAWAAYATPKTNFDIKPAEAAYGCGTDDGARTVYVRFRDSLGNAGSSYNTGEFTLTTVGPTLTSITITDTGGYGNDTTPTIDIVSEGSPSHAAFSCNGGTDWSAWIAYGASISSFDMTTGATGCNTTNGLKTITAKLKDAVNNESGTQEDTTTYDNTGPTGSISNLAGTSTNDDTPTLNLTIADAGVGTVGSEASFSCDNSTWTAWAAYATPKSDFDIKPDEAAYGCGIDAGAKTVYVRFRDSLGNVGSSYNTGEFTLDILAPTLTSITINDTGGFGNDTTPAIDIVSADSPSHVAFSCNGGTNWSGWIVYGDSIDTFNITTGAVGCSTTNESKTITAKLKDSAGNETGTVSDDTYYDNAGPIGSISDLTGTSTSDDTPSLVLTIDDTGVGTSAAEMSFSCNDSDWSAWTAYATPKTNFDVKPADTEYGCGTSDGARTVYVRFKDSLGNIGSSYNTGSFTLDMASPTLTSITITDSAGYTNDTTPTIDIASEGSPSHVAFSCNGGTNWSAWIAYGDSISSFNMTTGAVGCSATNELKTITAKLKDAAANESGTQADTTTYDSAGPTGSITNYTGQSINDDTPSLALSIADPGVGTGSAEKSFSCDDSTWTDWAAYATPEVSFDIKPDILAQYGCGTADGARTVYVRYRDSLGNIGSSYNTGAFTLDTAAPTLTSITIVDTDSFTNDPTPELTFDSAGSPTEVKFSCDGGNTYSGWTAYSDSITTFNMLNGVEGCTTEDGIKYVRARIRDAAGNESVFREDSTNYDSTGPTGSIGDLSGQTTADDTPSMALTIADAFYGTIGAQMSFSCDNSTWSAWDLYSTPKTDFDVKPDVATYGCTIADGARTVYVRFRDALGNIGSAYNTGSFTLDTTAPALTSVTISDTAGFTNDATPAFTIVSSGVPTQASFSCNGGENWSLYQLYSDSMDIFNITNGEIGCTATNELKTISVILKDAVGNVSTPVSDTTFYDNTGPTGSISDLTGQSTNDDTPSLVLSIADAGVGTVSSEMSFSCDNSLWSAWGAYATPKSDFDIKPDVTTYGCANTDGARTVYVRFRDSLGNVGSSYNTGSFSLDTTAPNAPVVSGTTPTNDTTPTWSWVSGGGGNGNYRYKLDSSDLTSGATTTAELSYTPGTALSEGAHTLYVEERDDVGNWSTSGSKSITVDTTGPTAPSALPAAGTYSSLQSVLLTAANDAANTYYTLDNTEPANSSTPYTIAITVDAADSQTKTLKAVSYDALGNKGTVMTAAYVFEKNKAPAIAVTTIMPSTMEDYTVCQVVRNRVLLMVAGSDQDGDSLTYSITGRAQGMGFEQAGSSGRRFSWAANQTGSAQVTFAVTDGTASAQQAVTINIVNSLTECAAAADNGNNEEEEGEGEGEGAEDEEPATSQGSPVALACFGNTSSTAGACNKTKVATYTTKRNGTALLNASNSYQPMSDGSVSADGIIYHWSQVSGGGCPTVSLSDNNSATAVSPEFLIPVVSSDGLLACRFKLEVEKDSVRSAADYATVKVIHGEASEDRATSVPYSILGELDGMLAINVTDMVSGLSSEESMITFVRTNGSITTLDDYASLDSVFSVKVAAANLHGYEVEMSKAGTGDGGAEEYIIAIPKYQSGRGGIWKFAAASASGEVIDLEGDEKVDVDAYVGEAGARIGGDIHFADVDTDGVVDMIFKAVSGGNTFIGALLGGNLNTSPVTVTQESYYFSITGELSQASIVGVSSTTQISEGYTQGPQLKLSVIGSYSMMIDIDNDILTLGDFTIALQDLYDSLNTEGRAYTSSGFGAFTGISLEDLSWEASAAAEGESTKGAVLYNDKSAYYTKRCPLGYKAPAGFDTKTCDDTKVPVVGADVSGKTATVNADEMNPDVIEEGDTTNIATGDVNGDGFDDTIVGDSTAMEIYVFYGTADFVGAKDSQTADVTMTCPAAGSGCGTAVISGDLSGDGYDDIMIGAPTSDGEDGSLTEAGEVYVVYGSPELPATIDIATSSSVQIIYGNTAGGYFGYDMVVLDSDANGVMELACNLRTGGAVVISFDILESLGRTLSVEQLKLAAVELNDPTRVVMLKMTMQASLDEELAVDNITLTASGSGRDDNDIVAVLLYEDVDGDWELGDNDRRIGSATEYEEDDGQVVFTGLGETIAAGTSEQWLVVYVFPKDVDLESLQMSVVRSQNIPAIYMIGLLLSIMLAWRVLRRNALIVMILIAAMGINACKSGLDFESVTSGTYTYRVAIANSTDIAAIGVSSGERANIVGAPMEGEEVTITFTEVSEVSGMGGGGGCSLVR